MEYFDEPEPMPKELLNEPKPQAQELEEVNMAPSDSEPKPIFVSKDLAPSERKKLLNLIRKYIDVFAWSYE